MMHASSGRWVSNVASAPSLLSVAALLWGLCPLVFWTVDAIATPFSYCGNTTGMFILDLSTWAHADV